MNLKTSTPLLLGKWEGKLAVNPNPVRNKPLRGGMVVEVEGQRLIQIPLTRGRFAFIDECDAPTILAFNWYCSGKENHMYANRKVPKTRGRVHVLMHRQVAGLDSPQVDHKNGYGLDNRRENLRKATPSQNQANAVKRAVPASSKSKGVDWVNRNQKWRARIQFNGVPTNLGYFKSESEAIAAYESASRKIFGEFALINRQKYE
jgi:hypothetical protein